MSDLVGRLVGGKYRVVQRLGSGGVAEVYEVVHEEIGQRFALKVLKREFAAYPEVAERFLVEARAASAVRHPGVVQIFDYGKLDGGEPYLMMELLEGESLADLEQRRKKLPHDQAVGLMIHVLDALDAAHRAGVVHRDLKPENVVLVRGPGGEPWAKLIDFGIARLAHEGAVALRRTAQGTVMGTAYYMSPEQARGASSIDGRADVYAAGVMLYEMLTGRLPYRGDSASEILAKALTEPFPSARTLEPALPAALDETILKATARRRELRFQSAQEFAQALRPLKPELVAVQFLSAEEEAELETTGIRRLQELSARLPELHSRERTPPRISIRTPPHLPGRASRPPSPPRGTVRNPPIRRSQPPIETARNTIVISRWTVFVGATLGVAAVAATVGALLVVISDRTPGPSDAALGGADYAVAAPGQPLAVPNLGMIAERASRPAAAAALVAPLPPPVAAPAPAIVEQPPVAPTPVAAPAPATATVRLVGLPAGAQVTLDGRPVGPAFPLEVSDAPHTLRVVARGQRPFVHEFRVAGDLEIQVVLERAGSSTRAVARPTLTPPAAPVAEPGAANPRPLANPFGGP
jgi:serine/threonine protein kinase